MIAERKSNPAAVMVKEFANQSIHQRADGYLNATEMCKVGGKEWYGYIRNKQTQEYLDALSADMKISKNKLMESIKGGDSKKQGTWVHPRVATHLAQWISPKFAVKVSGWIEEWYNQSYPNYNEFMYEISNLEASRSRQQELEIQKDLATKLNGLMEVETEVGRIDVLVSNETIKYVIEIKEVSCWKHAVGQVICYGEYYPEHKKKIVLFGETSNRELILAICGRHDIEVEFV